MEFTKYKLKIREIFSNTSGAIQYGLPLNEKGQCCPLIWEEKNVKKKKHETKKNKQVGE
jgi:hypothetical protein